MTRFRIALDAMGGDSAPSVPVQAAIEAATSLDVGITLVGDEPRIRKELQSYSYPTHLIDFVDAPDEVTMEDEAVAAIRRKRRASIPVALQLLSDGECNAFVSAGNTGAVVAASVISLGRMPGVHRPGIAVPIPTAVGPPVLLIDAGAIVDPKPENLWQHARLAATYARFVVGIESPTVGLVSNGEEKGKGNALTRAAFELLASDPELVFLGNIEPRAIAERPCDVLVTDGFTGNIILKTGEGIVTLVQQSLRQEFSKRIYTGLLATLLKPAFRRAGKSLDYREYGGAPLLGVNGMVTIAHGSSDKRAIFNAVAEALKAAENETLTALRNSISNV